MKMRTGLMVLAALIGLAGLALAGGSRQYSVTLTSTDDNLQSGTVTLYICSNSLCTSPVQIGVVTISGASTTAVALSGPSTAKAFSYQVSQTENGADQPTGANAELSPNPLGVPVSIGRNLQITVGAASTSTGGKKK